jgi:hypothetical protein
MKYSIEFQYKAARKLRPSDQTQDEPIEFHAGETIPIPNVGDSVSYREGGQTVARKVLTRHFSYFGSWCKVNIVVTDISAEELRSRLKD